MERHHAMVVAVAGWLAGHPSHGRLLWIRGVIGRVVVVVEGVVKHLNAWIHLTVRK